MGFQSQVRLTQTTGIVGEILEGAPRSGYPAILNSTSAANNVIGRGFSKVAGNDDEVAAGEGDTLPFAGILVNPKVYSTSGASTGALDPTITLLNNEVVEILEKGIIVVDFSTAATIGQNVFYHNTTGVIAAATGTTLADHTQIPDANVIRRSIPSAGLGIIRIR